MYSLLKFIHIVSVIAWVGGLATMLLLNRLFAKAGDPAALRVLGQQSPLIGMRVFLPAMVLTLLTGIGLVHQGNLDFGSAWIIWGMSGLVLSFIIGGILTGGAARKLGQRMARGELDAAGAAAIQRRIMLFAVLNLLLLLSVVWAMVAKPA